MDLRQDATSSVQPTSQDASSSSTANVRLYCYCQVPEEDNSSEIIGCDNPNCSTEWFHTKCLKIISIPKGKWYCPDCHKSKN